MTNKNLKPIPKFKSENAERKFWATHDTTEYFDYSRKIINPIFPFLKPISKSISLRLPESMLAAIKITANKMDVPYQSFIKTILADRMKQEFTT